MSKTGYFVNVNNYIPCEHCVEGYDKITMLCTQPYYYHMRREILKAPDWSKLTGIRPV